MSNTATCGVSGQIRATASMPARLCGWCEGASGASAAISSRMPGSMRAGPAKRVPPCTTRWPTAAILPAARYDDPVKDIRQDRRVTVASGIERRGPIVDPELRDETGADILDPALKRLRKHLVVKRELDRG